jgi:hypothetical protein
VEHTPRWQGGGRLLERALENRWAIYAAPLLLRLGARNLALSCRLALRVRLSALCSGQVIEDVAAWGDSPSAGSVGRERRRPSTDAPRSCGRSSCLLRGLGRTPEGGLRFNYYARSGKGTARPPFYIGKQDAHISSRDHRHSGRRLAYLTLRREFEPANLRRVIVAESPPTSGK